MWSSRIIWLPVAAQQPPALRRLSNAPMIQRCSNHSIFNAEIDDPIIRSSVIDD
jgi:hypothetical protein